MGGHMSPVSNAFEELATESKQDAVIDKLEDLIAATPDSPETGLATEVTLAEIDGKLPTALHVDGGVKVHLLNPTTNPETGLAKETTLGAIQTLVGVLATQATQSSILTAINAVAKDASVDNVESALVTLNAKDFATHTEQSAISAILTQIATNTGTAAVEIADLELTADQVNLNTDQLETILTSLNSTDFATSAKQTAAQATFDAINTKLGGALTINLPTGAATAAKQDSIITALGGTLVTNVSDRAARLLGHVTIDNSSLAVTGPLTDAQIRATALLVSGPLTDAQLRASTLPVSLDLSTLATQTTLAAVDTKLGGTLAVSGPLTDAQLRAAAVPVSGPLTNTQLTAQGLSTSAKQDTLATLLPNVADASTQADSTRLGVGSHGYVWDPVNSLWRRATGAQDGRQFVGLTGALGNTADGVNIGNTNLPSIATYLFNGGTYDRARGDSVGGLRVYNRPDDVTTGTITANGQSVTATVKDGMGSVVFSISGTYGVLTINFEVSFDGGTNYWLCSVAPGSTSGVPVVSQALTANQLIWYEAALPAGTTHVRVRSSTYASGTANVRISQAQAGYEPAPSISGGIIGLSPGVNRIGSVLRSGIWQDDTATALAASGTFTGATRDVTASVTNGVIANGYPEEFRALAISDVSGTLRLEVSRDNVTWREIKSVPTTLVRAGGLYTAEILYRPATRYARIGYVNDATAQGHFTAQTMML